ncbi:GGDEF domain-containing protein [Shewanella sp. NIFS-20-20]|uniref:GGDEF domain-containing protein n=1 Tax=Shewanella sp. NIFS-20-20 TaxID=2853806 RepID=UPI001C4789AA|nr:GGDEF domain-containing protein [Shewanella sp. NIFS-20-20]MBV7316242.1 GGDEF domain-containing protein [Shewanella sp. NIFS-20-20]
MNTVIQLPLTTRAINPQSYCSIDDAPSALSTQEQVAIIQRLHASLAPEHVVSAYGQLVGQWLPLIGLKLHYHGNKCLWGRQSGKQCHRTLTPNISVQYYMPKTLTNEALALLQLLESWFTPAINNAIIHSQVSDQAMADSLTQLGNRRAFEISIDKALARSGRNGLPLTLMVLDLDNFKQVNDHQGHQQGDVLLQQFADILAKQLRDTDKGFRIGGDEFVVLLDAPLGGAHLLANRILNDVKADKHCISAKIGVSIGLAQWQAGATASQLYQEADKALYLAKASGKHTARSIEP